MLLLASYVYSTLQQIVVTCKLQVYSTLDRIQQIVAAYKLQVFSTLDSLQQIVAT